MSRLQILIGFGMFLVLFIIVAVIIAICMTIAKTNYLIEEKQRKAWKELPKTFRPLFHPTLQIKIDSQYAPKKEVLPRALISVDQPRRMLAISYLAENSPVDQITTDYISFDDIGGGKIEHGYQKTHSVGYVGSFFYVGNSTQNIYGLVYRIRLKNLQAPLYCIPLTKKYITETTPFYKKLMESVRQLDAVIQNIADENKTTGNR